ncbi:MAG: response regulator transcription factor [Kiritimatiellae bacterium]|jgi:DNA-binding NarL/FixJ family response regulator|nr:response regulator transcription factor [Kiritimatiellia bacterium]
MKKIRILIADDHMLMRMGVSALISSTADMEIVGEAKNGRQAAELAKTLKPDVVIMDLMMPEMLGSEATGMITAADPDIKVIVLTTYGSSIELAKAIQNGAVGILLKDKVDMDLVNTIRFVVAGNQVIPTRLLKQIEQDKALSQLTDRQLTILASVAQGQSNSDIAKSFGLSEITIKKHLSSIFERLGVANRSEAVALALRKQMLKV